MAFTETQRVAIRTWLGWSERFHQTNSALEQAMNAVEGVAEAQANVEVILTELDSIEVALKDARNRLKASKVGSIDLNKNEVPFLRSEGRRWVGKLARRFGVRVMGDPFSAGLPSEGNLMRY